ncbi:Molybdenum cofactor insertion chaperone PaoD [Durusdinium trenchii]|uniref:Molybdenum cofactor insertion chaperone PaoD n=1 Tax=Durusdinium trenchii TaxID=1381693 RepID=A0ABP0LLE3_9DINO
MTVLSDMAGVRLRILNLRQEIKQRSDYLIPLRNISEHPRDVLRYAAASIRAGERCALAIIADIEGPSARAVGAMMAVSNDNKYAGYISNGCVDADIARHALSALHTQAPKRVRYGAGSPYVDIRLPCGGSVEIVFVPDPKLDILTTVIDTLDARQAITLSVNEDSQLNITAHSDCKDNFSLTYAPPLRIAVAGRGEETISLARLANAAHYDVIVHSPDMDVLDACSQFGVNGKRLHSISDAPDFPDDPWSAIVCLFHDHEWEADILTTALNTQAFYIGAMGSRRTHEARLDELRNRNINERTLQRIRGPIGLIPSVRDASKLAISTLAEIISLYRSQPEQ